MSLFTKLFTHKNTPIIEDHFEVISLRLEHAEAEHAEKEVKTEHAESEHTEVEEKEVKAEAENAEEKEVEEEKEVVVEEPIKNKNKDKDNTVIECKECENLRFQNKCLIGLLLLTSFFYFKKE
jgi:hypothetical protein